MEDIKTISALVENDAIFQCQGYSEVKVTQRDQGANQTQTVRIPIKAAGVLGYKEHLEQKAPKPPVLRQAIKADSERGRALALKEDAEIMVFDNTDKAYVEALAEHGKEFVWRVAIFAMDIEWQKADGNEATTYEEKKAILQKSGITGAQLDKIFADVVALSRFTEDRTDFLSRS